MWVNLNNDPGWYRLFTAPVYLKRKRSCWQMEGEAAEVRFVFVRNQTAKVASKMTNPDYTNKKRTSSLIFKHYYFADNLTLTATVKYLNVFVSSDRSIFEKPWWECLLKSLLTSMLKAMLMYFFPLYQSSYMDSYHGWSWWWRYDICCE